MNELVRRYECLAVVPFDNMDNKKAMICSMMSGIGLSGPRRADTLLSGTPKIVWAPISPHCISCKNCECSKVKESK